MARSNVATESFSGTLASWAQWYPGWGAASISSGGVQFPGGAATGIRWTGTGSPAGDDQYCKCTVNGGGWYGTSYRRGVAVRMQGSDATRTCYWVRVWWDSGGARTWEIGKTVNGTETQLATTTRSTADSGDTIAIEAEGTSLRAYHNDVEVTALAVTDAEITGGTWGLVGQDIAAGFVSDDADMGDLIGASIAQEGSRWGNDDGAENAHSHAAAMDTSITAPADAVRIINIVVDATGAPGSVALKLQVELEGGTGWTDVPVQ